MARHVITVSIFCFICATHSPCASHVAVDHGNLHPHQAYNDPNDPNAPLSENWENVKEKVNAKFLLADQTYNDSADTLTMYDKKKRSSESNNDSDINSDTIKESDFLKKIFLEYGNGDVMTFQEFEKLISRLDMLHVFAKKMDDHKSEDAPSLDLGKEINAAASNETCLQREDITSLVTKQSSGSVINQTTFQAACPILLYNILTKTCHEDSEDSFGQTPIASYSNGLVWIYSMLAVVLISICGVLALAIIPVMQKKFYKPLIQFLVALAVGTLAGDALLHLLPHAMSSSHGHEHEEHADAHNHDENTWKGFVAMLGLTFFFIMERLILLAGKWRKKKQKHKHTHVKVLNEEGDRNHKNDTQCMDRYNPSPYCYKDIMNDSNGTFLESDKTATTVLELDSNSDIQSIKKSRSPTVETMETNQNMTECPAELSLNTCTEANKMLPHHDHDDYTVIVREHATDHHGHSHKHGHVHAAPQNLSSVAWMVIMGDGLHNFTDGMAIGAAFSGGLAGGFSTTVAVFCHELPHELGDFAMLLKAGMTIKQALFYNMLSSILCIFGNIFGLWLGNTDYASSWVFAAAAGMFIYIALVDMIPELSSAHEDEDNFLQCILHLSGLLSGFGIMTLIALYEQDLKHIFN